MARLNNQRILVLVPFLEVEICNSSRVFSPWGQITFHVDQDSERLQFLMVQMGLSENVGLIFPMK